MSSDLATLKLKVDVLRRLIRMLHRRRTEQTVTAANLLAHQQARGIEAREEEEQGVKDYLELRDHADALAVDLADYRRRERDYRAENERLRAELVVRAMDVSGDRTLCKRCRTTRWMANDPSDPAWQARRENHPHERSCPLFRAALGEEVRDA